MAELATTPTTTTDEEPTVETLFLKIEELNALSKWFNRTGKALIRKNTKASRRRATTNQKSGFDVPVKIATTLADFLQVDPNDYMPRTEVTKRLTNYIKSNSLQCEDNKKHFVCDEALAKVFSIETGTQTNWFEMQKFLAKLLISVKKQEGEGAAATAATNNATSDAKAAKASDAGGASTVTSNPGAAQVHATEAVAKKKLKKGTMVA